ncbi:hypothetical protein BN8_05227 [Fibrisoma limi BUZ 3]|uniref:Uncharacterized protein n=1 Tax=Fibrisoma limi BUZ 3 TaxID=1185876 RepID=I2GPU9_9BACT|nr:hypothetical protein BN8_05227 [Fibrisoma limi BUZ 3]
MVLGRERNQTFKSLNVFVKNFLRQVIQKTG